MEYCAIQGVRTGEKFEEIFNQEGRFDFVLFDGVRSNNQICSDVSLVLNGALGRTISKIVRATSLSFRIRGQDGIRGKDFDQLHFISWKYEEYEAAFKVFLSKGELGDDLAADIIEVNKGLRNFSSDGILIGDDKIDGANTLSEEDDDTMVSANAISEEDVLFYLEQKFFYAGGSARFMYEYTKEELITELTVLFALVKDWTVFTSIDIPGGEAIAVNSLMQQFTDERGRNPKCLAVSQYVLLHAATKNTESLVDAVSAMAVLTGNPSLQGWAFELRQIEVIKSAFKERETGGSAYIGNTEGLALLPRSEIAYNGSLFVPDVNIGDDTCTIIWCLKWNQGCFDVAFYVGTKLVTLQFTNHSLKLQYVTSLRNALVAKGKTVSQVVHIAVVESDVQQFRFKTAEGTGRRTHDVDYTVNIFHTTSLARMEAGIGTVNERVELASGYKIDVYGKRKQPPGPGLG